ncbi:hypothetical protein D3C79_1016770 [compost metagenome]
MLQLALNHVFSHPGHGAGDVADQQGLLLRIHQAEQRPGVTVVVGVFAVIVTIGDTVQGQ